MRALFPLVLVLTIAGCLATPINPTKVFEGEQPLSPYFLANKYAKLMQQCWFDDDPDFERYYQIETFPPTVIDKYDAKRLLVILEPKPTQFTNPTSVLEVHIEEQSSSGPLDQMNDFVKTSSVTVFTNDNIYPDKALMWFDLKRWINGDEECSPSSIEL